jgi:signal transduction histidine kinase
VGGNAFGRGGPSDNRYTVSAEIQDTYEHALSIAAVGAAVAGVVIATVLAGLLLRTLIRRIRQLESATAALAAGDYSVVLPEPPEAELKGLVDSINELGATLYATEENRARLVSDLAHELRNPLTSISGYMEGLIDGVLPADETTFSVVAEEADRLTRLTNDLSLLARAQESALDLNLQRIDLARVSDIAGQRLLPQYDAKGVNLVSNTPRGLEIDGDSDRLVQALTNIVGNALTHTPAGGTVTITGSADSNMCRLEVSDTGTGIPQTHLETIFERFTRLDPTGSGIGIGLNIARTIVRAHGGDITARSDNTGSTFEISVPAASPRL